MRQPTRRAVHAAALLAMLSLASSALAQGRDYYARGRVLDEQKKPLPDVEITLVDASTSRTFHMKTDEKGEFKFAGLPHAKYDVTFAREGYVTVKDTWKVDTPQERMQKVDVPDVVLVSQAQAAHSQQLKEADAGVKKACEKIRGGDFDGAIALLEPVLARNPADANAHFYVGLARVGKQQYREAVESLTRVTELQPDFPGAWLELGICYDKLGQTEKALSAYDRNLQLEPADTAALYNSGLVLFGANRVDEALARFEKGIALKPADPDLLDMAARCYVHQGQFARAADDLEKARAATTDPARIAQLDALIAQVKAQIK
jgi:tetratricopeptide (TPR) repeat protein